MEPDAQALADAVLKMMEDSSLRESCIEALQNAPYSAETYFEEYGKRVFA